MEFQVPVLPLFLVNANCIEGFLEVVNNEEPSPYGLFRLLKIGKYIGYFLRGENTSPFRGRGSVPDLLPDI